MGERRYIIECFLRSGYDRLTLGPIGVHERKRAILHDLIDGLRRGFNLDMDLRLLQRIWSDLKRRNFDEIAEIVEGNYCTLIWFYTIRFLKDLASNLN
ncbi:hypothetical protein XENTR_v10012480 [Xenopus tropicalis]|nr:hypothetical protein XENTR_v10012480 [Xenopus tropicalis]